MGFVHFFFNVQENDMIADYFFAVLMGSGYSAGLVKTWTNGTGFRYVEFCNGRVAWRI